MLTRLPRACVKHTQSYLRKSANKRLFVRPGRYEGAFVSRELATPLRLYFHTPVHFLIFSKRKRWAIM